MTQIIVYEILLSDLERQFSAGIGKFNTNNSVKNPPVHIVVYRSDADASMIARLYYRCSAMAVPNYAKSGPYFEGWGKSAEEAIGDVVSKHGRNESFNLKKFLDTIDMREVTPEQLGRFILSYRKGCPINIYIDTSKRWGDLELVLPEHLKIEFAPKADIRKG